MLNSRRSAVFGITSLMSAIPAGAQVAQFEVDPAASALVVSGTALGAPIQAQGPGSLTTTYHGALFVQLEPSAINFPGGSEVTANNSGNWQPLPGGASGSAPANYGGRVVVLFVTSLAAVRDAVFDGTSPAPFTLSGANSATFSSGIDFISTSGNIDYNSPLAGTGTSPIAGSVATNTSPNPGGLTITPAAGGFASAALTLPVSFTIVSPIGTLGEGVFNFNGAITARATARGGDSNFDGRVSLEDFNNLASNFGATSGQGWLSGDFTFDGIVNLEDFNVLASNFGLTGSPGGPTGSDWTALASAVPEPALTVLFPFAAACVGCRRRRRRLA